MLKFYDVDESYADYLRQVDKKIPYIGYNSNNKFICGVVLNINDLNYYAPISSNTEKQRTNLPIYNKKGEIKATIRFCFMFPAPMTVLTEKNFKESNKLDKKYTDLLSIEYDYCLANEPTILAKAESVYEIGCNKNHKFNFTCCDFKALEEAYYKYEYGKLYDKISEKTDTESQIS